MTVIPGEFQHRLVVTDLVKKKMKKVVRKEAIERRKVWKLKEDNTRARFEGRVGELVSTDAPVTWWWNEGSNNKKEGCTFIRRCVKVGLRRTRQDTRT